MVRRARGRFTAILVLLALCVAVNASSAGSIGATGARTAQVTPAKDVGDQVLRVSWRGFRPTQENGFYIVTIMECRLRPTSINKDCNVDETYPLSLTGNQAQGVTQANGTGNAFIDIQSTARLPALACSHTNPCSLLVFENPPEGTDYKHLPTAYATVKLDFRQNVADCPPPRRFDVRVEAESSAAAAFYEWAAGLCGGSEPFALDVTNTSSTAARHEFFEKHVDVGVTSVPPQGGEVTTTSPPFLVAPVDLTAVVVAYVIVDPVTGQQITDLTLSPRLVARLVSDSDVLTLFTDPEFQKLNPRHTFPQQTAEPGLRGEQNGDSWIVTKWLESDPVARKFLDGKDPYGVTVNAAWKGIDYPTDVLEARDPTGSYLPRTGEETVAQRLFHTTKPSDGVSSNPADAGFFAVLDLPTARRFALPIAKLTAGEGKPVVTLSPASVEAGYKTMTTTRDGFHVGGGSGDPAAWPLTKVDHALVPTPSTSTDPARLASIARLLQYAAGPGQHRLPDGFVPMPAGLAAQTTQAAAVLAPPPTTTTTNPATVAPSSVTDPGSFAGVPTDPAPASASPGSAPPAGAVPAADAVKAAEKVERRPTDPVFAVSASALERFALPIVLLVGLLTFAFGAADLTRRKVAGARK